jgi:hypothetical protein
MFGEMTKPVKIAQIDPYFFQHPPATSSNSHAYLISQRPVTPPLYIYSNLFLAECQKYVFSAKLQTKHPLHSYSLIYTYP